MEHPRAEIAEALDQHDGPAVGAGEDPVDALGPKMRDLRRRKGMTLSEVAEQAGLSVGHLSQVERGLSTPTIRQLQAIARTMGVTIGWFFRGEEERGPDDEDGRVVVRADKRRRIEMPSLGLVDELLVPDLDGPLELLHCTLEPGSGSGPEAYTHEGAEAGLVLEGEMELFVSERRYHLKAGDSFAFASTEPHRYRNTGAEPLKLVWAITPPTY
ncbi:cupin domain-containing protein [Antarcticirhabdus aurantiaca]|uniref:Cupin domain-containing protein n=1 Tax=Antarcticirhabdus aurantiaca TaxID=2606717 RepID=A0ACD4NR24_9HYPH|nr:cupin domain-containing protein [Antarcticirhabdus aurantiaca]WAJ29203.1 cupin domain-containing protein [Jeongeuplla avenae]